MPQSGDETWSGRIAASVEMLFDSALVVASLKSCQFSGNLFFFFLTSLLKLHFLIAIFLKSSMLFASSKESSHNYPFFFILFLLNPWSGVQTTPPLFVQGQTRSKNFLGRSLLMYCRRRDTQCPGQMSRLSISLVRGPHPGVIHSIL